MNGKLNIFETARIAFNAYFDLKHDRIQLITTERELLKPRSGDWRPEERFPEPVSEQRYLCLQAPTVYRELANYVAYKDYFLAGRANLYWALAFDVCPIIRISSFSGMLGYLDEQINKYEAHLNLLSIQYSEEIGELNRKREEYGQRQEPHLVQLCINKARLLREAYYNKSKRYYKALILLLTQKLNRLKRAEDYLLARRSRSFLRIRCYHEKVSQYSPYAQVQIPSCYPQDDFLCGLAKAETADRYREVWERTCEDLRKYREELDRVTPAGKNMTGRQA